MSFAHGALKSSIRMTRLFFLLALDRMAARLMSGATAEQMSCDSAQTMMAAILRFGITLAAVLQASTHHRKVEESKHSCLMEVVLLYCMRKLVAQDLRSLMAKVIPESLPRWRAHRLASTFVMQQVKNLPRWAQSMAKAEFCELRKMMEHSLRKWLPSQVVALSVVRIATDHALRFSNPHKTILVE